MTLPSPAALPRRLRWMVAVLLVFLVLGLAGDLVFGLAPDLTAGWLGSSHEQLALVVKGMRDSAAILLVLALLAWAIASERELGRFRGRSARLLQGIDALSIGIALWDGEDRLVACNDAFRALYPEIAALLVPGALYVDLLRAYHPLAPAEVVDGRDLERFIEDSQRRRRSGQVSEIVRHHGGRWLMMTDLLVATGGVISFRMDVTEQRLFDLELRKRRKVLDDLAQLTSDWYWRTDAAGRFVEFSEAMEACLKYRPDDLIGRRVEEIAGFTADEPTFTAYKSRVGAHEALPWLTCRVERADGAAAWIALSGRPMFDAHGTFIGYFGAGRDVTEREAAFAQLRQSEERFRALTALATEWYWETDAELRITQLHGPSDQEPQLQRRLLGRSLLVFVEDPRYAVDPATIEAQLRRREAFRRVPFRFQKDAMSAETYYECSAEPIFVDGRFTGYRGLSWDVTERGTLIRQLTESEARFRALTELSSDWFWEMDEQFRFTSIRQGAARSLPFEETELIGRQRWDLPGELVRPATWDEHRADLDARRKFRDLIVRRLDAEGRLAYTLTSGDPYFDASGRFLGYRGIGKNITEQVRAQERIERLATMDPLTQLVNRQTFDERAARLLSDAYAQGKLAALLWLDLDDFGLLNKGYGHRVGDQMLRIVAGRMKSVIGEHYLIGRRGGDELVALCVDLPKVEAAAEVAQGLIASVSEPARVLGMEVGVTPSVGIAVFPHDGVDLDSLLNAADAAMFEAKQNGKRTYRFYTQELRRKEDLRLRLEHRLRRAVEARDFRLFYQPIVSLADGKMVGAECLTRWNDSELGEIMPNEFIPIALKSGLIIGLGDWVLREACRARQVWHSLGLDVPPLAINMTGVQLSQLGCVDDLLDVLAEFHVAPNEIEIEVTEQSLFETTGIARENLVRLRNAGVRLALDDFGTGFSSLAHLRELPIQHLKIDRSFTRECMRDARTLTIVKAVIDMARSLGINVTAEGVETQAQQTWMQHLGCESAQGFLFAKPMPAEEFLKMFINPRGAGRGERSLMH